MSDANRLLFLRIALIIIGLTFIFGIYTLCVFWPSGWAWGQGHSHYLMMIIGVYATLGVFLLIDSRNPYAHKSLIWFTVWSSVVHAAIMGVQALSDPAERGSVGVAWALSPFHSAPENNAAEAAQSEREVNSADDHRGQISGHTIERSAPR